MTGRETAKRIWLFSVVFWAQSCFAQPLAIPDQVPLWKTINIVQKDLGFRPNSQPSLSEIYARGKLWICIMPVRGRPTAKATIHEPK